MVASFGSTSSKILRIVYPEDNIKAFIREIPAEMLERICQAEGPFEAQSQSSLA